MSFSRSGSSSTSRMSAACVVIASSSCAATAAAGASARIAAALEQQASFDRPQGIEFLLGSGGSLLLFAKAPGALDDLGVKHRGDLLQRRGGAAALDHQRLQKRQRA